MYLKVSASEYVESSRIIGIFDMDTSTVSVNTRKFLSVCEKKGMVTSADGDIPKSFLLLDGKKEKEKKYVRKNKEKEKSRKGEKIFLCKLSSSVLYGRLCASLGDVFAEEEV